MTPEQFNRRQLDMVLRALNQDDLPGLHEYTNTWLHAGSDYNKWVSENPRLAKHFKQKFEGLRPVAEFDEGQPLTLEGDVAAFLFATLLVNPLRNELRSCPQCGKYFYTADSRKYFCIRKHVIAFRAQRAMGIDRAKKLLEIDKLLEKRGSRKDWKQWLHAHSNFSRTYITRAVKQGYLDEDGELTDKSFALFNDLQRPVKEQYNYGRLTDD